MVHFDVASDLYKKTPENDCAIPTGKIFIVQVEWIRGPWWPWIAHLSHFSHKWILHLSSFGSTLWPPALGPVLIPRGIVWIKLTKFYKETLHTKNLSSIPSSFREEEFWSWSSLFLCSNLWPPPPPPPPPPRGGVSFDPKGIIWIKLIKVHKKFTEFIS